MPERDSVSCTQHSTGNGKELCRKGHLISFPEKLFATREQRIILPPRWPFVQPFKLVRELVSGKLVSSRREKDNLSEKEINKTIIVR